MGVSVALALLALVLALALLALSGSSSTWRSIYCSGTVTASLRHVENNEM